MVLNDLLEPIALLRKIYLWLVMVTVVLFLGSASPVLADPLDNWHLRNLSTQGNEFHSVTYGNDTFVAVGAGGSAIFTSQDGITWTKRTSGTKYSLEGVTYGNNIFVAVGYAFDEEGGYYYGAILTSPDGITWSKQESGTPYWLYEVTYGNNIFVAVGSGENAILTSSDGITWTNGTSGVSSRGISGITYGNNTFVAVGGDEEDILTSPDGITWTGRSGIGSSLRGVTYGNNIFVAVGYVPNAYPPADIILTSPDGVTWTNRGSCTERESCLLGVTYGNNTFVAVGMWDEGGKIITSPDGINWTSRTSGTENALFGVKYGKNTFVAVGRQDTILQSDKMTISGKDSVARLPSYIESNYGTVGVAVAEPIDSATGAHVLDRNILTLNGARDLTFDIHYNSLMINSGSMGKGWTHDYGAYLELIDDSEIKVHWSPNRVNTFNNNGQNQYTSSDQSMKDVTLNKNQDGSYTLTRKDQSQYLFNPSGILTKLKNTHGQALNLTYDGTNRLDKITEPVSGQSLTISYDANSLISTITDTLNRKAYFSYDSSKNLTGITDPNGKKTTYTYDKNGQVLTGTNSEGVLFFKNTYDNNGHVVSQFDGMTGHINGTFSYDEVTQLGYLITTYKNREGKTCKYVYDSKYNLISYTDELGNSTNYTYDEDSNCTSKTYADGTTMHNSYDSHGNILTLTNPAGNITTMTYDGKNNLLTSKNPEGKKITYTYNANNNITRITDPLGNDTDYAYDANGLLISETTSSINVTKYTYQKGLMNTATDPTGVITSYSHDAAGRLVTQTDALGKKTQYTYDANNNLITITDPLGNKTSYTYDSNGNKLTETDPKGNITRYTYNSNQKLISKIDPLNNETKFGYDGEDRLVTTTDPKGNVTTITYDAKGQTVSVKDALNHAVYTQYDSVGNIIGKKDALNKQILSISYDSNGNPTVTKDALNYSIIKEYDKLNRVKKSTNPKGQITQYNYDALNRLTTVKDAILKSSNQGFDTEGNRVSISDPNSNKTLFTYDNADRILSEKTADGSEIKYSYDVRGLLAKKTNGRSQVTTYQYDDAGRLKSYTDPVGTVSLTYDANGNILTIQDSKGIITRKYDALDRVTQYTDVWGNIIKYKYDSVGNLVTLTYPGSKAVNYQYDAANRLVKVTDWASRVTNYEYDVNNRLTKSKRPDGSVETKLYDVKGQLTQVEDKTADGTLINKYNYTYDEVGNIVKEISAAGSATSLVIENQKMVYGAGNRLLSYNGQNVVYDSDGNMTTGPLKGNMKTYAYDARNRLIGVGTTVYLYDAQNNRVGLNQGGVSTRYVVNPMATLSQLLMETDALGAPKAYYVYGIGLLGKQDAQGNLFSYHYDYRGSTVALTDKDGKVSDRYIYDAYGKATVILGTTPNPYKYNGRDGVTTDENGLYYMRARYYNSEIKRFVNQDIVLGSIEDGQTLNKFAYVNGQPVNYVDPFGLSRDSGDNNNSRMFRTIQTNRQKNSITTQAENILSVTDHFSSFAIGGFKCRGGDGFNKSRAIKTLVNVTIDPNKYVNDQVLYSVKKLDEKSNDLYSKMGYEPVQMTQSQKVEGLFNFGRNYNNNLDLINKSLGTNYKDTLPFLKR